MNNFSLGFLFGLVLCDVIFIAIYCCCGNDDDDDDGGDDEQIKKMLNEETSVNHRESLIHFSKSIRKTMEEKMRKNGPARLPDAGINPEEKEEATAEAKDDFFTLNSNRFD